MKSDVIDLRPAAVLILGGTFDIARKVPLTTIEANYAALADLAEANNLPPRKPLHVGQELIIPMSGVGPAQIAATKTAPGTRTSTTYTVRNGDTLLVPKTPNFVLVYGAVYNQTAITYRPGRNANWYLAQAGGPNQLADRPAIFVIRADGSIVGGQSSNGWFRGNPLGTALRPGDMVVVPEKALGQNQKWKTIMQAATTLSSIGTSAAIAARF